MKRKVFIIYLISISTILVFVALIGHSCFKKNHFKESQSLKVVSFDDGTIIKVDQFGTSVSDTCFIKIVDRKLRNLFDFGEIEKDRINHREISRFRMKIDCDSTIFSITKFDDGSLFLVICEKSDSSTSYFDGEINSPKFLVIDRRFFYPEGTSYSDFIDCFHFEIYIEEDCVLLNNYNEQRLNRLNEELKYLFIKIYELEKSVEETLCFKNGC